MIQLTPLRENERGLLGEIRRPKSPTEQEDALRSITVRLTEKGSRLEARKKNLHSAEQCRERDEQY